MAIQKKHGKGRLDKWYKLAKEKGYRARAAFKLIQLNKKYNFLDNAKVCIDLCAAPGSWCQVAAEVMPQNAIIIGCDLAPIKPIPRCITFQSDITTEDCRSKLRGHLKHWKADCVLHDGAPNVGTAWVQDAFTQAELALQSMKLATEFLREGGTFVTKVFRSRDFNSLMWVFNQLFDHVDATKPPSSRNVSAEIFVVCRGYKAPKKLDPKFVDPKTVFEELPDATPNNEAKVFKPELKKRKRDGYEEGDHLQFKEVPVTEFIETIDPIQLLGSINKINLFAAKDDLTAQAINKLPETTEEVRACCADLKVLGKKDFRLLLKWRLSVREKFGLSLKKVDPNKKQPEPAATETTETEVTEMDEELRIEKELQELKERETTKKKKEKRKSNEAKRKEIIRLQLNMQTPMDIGLEQQGADGDQEFFALRKVDKLNAVNVVAKGKMNMVVEEEDSKKNKDFFFEEEEEELESDDEEDRLERELDGMYEQYVERKAEADAKFRAKRSRKEHEDGEWHGFGEEEEEEESDGEVSRALVESDISDSSDDEDEEGGPLIKTLNDDSVKGADGLSKKAKLFFDQEIFAGIADEEGESEDEDEGDEEMEDVKEDVKEAASDVEMAEEESEEVSEEEDVNENDSDYETEDEDGMVVVRGSKDDSEWDSKPDPMKNGRIDIDIVTAEAMTLAHDLATGRKTKEQLIDEGFNKMSFRDTEGLPEWFMDDENRHSKQLRPISKAAADAIKEKNKALNARPIKKVREAKARKKFKLHQRMEKMKKKSSDLADDEGLTEKEKASTITKLMAKAVKKRPKKKVTVVVATGPNKGNGRPKGTKGKYKMVDARLKKDVRALKRVAKKAKKGGRK